MRINNHLLIGIFIKTFSFLNLVSLECGEFTNLTKNRGLLTARIVGGTTAEVGEFPWQVSIQRIKNAFNPSWVHFCGGSIIDDNHILTALKTRKPNLAATQRDLAISIYIGERTANDIRGDRLHFEAKFNGYLGDIKFFASHTLM